jgi:hypothetical protein
MKAAASESIIYKDGRGYAERNADSVASIGIRR